MKLVAKQFLPSRLKRIGCDAVNDFLTRRSDDEAEVNLGLASLAQGGKPSILKDVHRRPEFRPFKRTPLPRNPLRFDF